MSVSENPSHREQRATTQHIINPLEGTVFPAVQRVCLTHSQKRLHLSAPDIQRVPHQARCEGEA